MGPTLAASDWINILSPAANLVMVAFVIPAVNQNRQTQTQLAVLRYQVALLMRKNGIDAPDEAIPSA